MALPQPRDEQVGFRIAPPGWSPDSPNPFTPDGAYDSGWRCFQFIDADDDRRVTGRTEGGLLHCTVGRRCDGLQERLADLLRYEFAYGRTVIVACPPDVDARGLVDDALARWPSSQGARADDPRWVVHSTSTANYGAIRACGELRCLSLLGREMEADAGVGLRDLGDPVEYSDYVMLGRIDSIGPEYVVASQQAGKLLPKPDAVYRPGVRLYFDCHRIVRDGLAVRDGLHEIKVRHSLPLDPYLVLAVSVADVDPAGEAGQWTTSEFLAVANAHFQRHRGSE